MVTRFFVVGKISKNIEIVTVHCGFRVWALIQKTVHFQGK